MQTLTIAVLPQDEPVTLDEAKAHLRIDHTDEDQLIRLWIKAAREYAEKHCHRRFVTQTVTVKLDCWPYSDPLYSEYRGMAGWPYGAIRLQDFGPGDLSTDPDDIAITYRDANGVSQTLDPDDYQIDFENNPPLIAPAPNAVWPQLELNRLKPISISLVAGKGQGQVPASVKEAILLTLTYWDENRGGEGAEAATARGLSAGALRLLDVNWTGAYV